MHPFLGGLIASVSHRFTSISAVALGAYSVSSLGDMRLIPTDRKLILAILILRYYLEIMLERISRWIAGHDIHLGLLQREEIRWHS